jgi:hypothetical protein
MKLVLGLMLSVAFEPEVYSLMGLAGSLGAARRTSKQPVTTSAERRVGAFG